MITGSGTLTKTKRAELRGVILHQEGLNPTRYLCVTPDGPLRIDAAAVKTEENLDGKYLLRTSDPRLSIEDIALGYKQLLEVERGWRDLKQVIDLRPVYRRKEERFRAHVILCWLALLLIRIADTRRQCHLGQDRRRAGPAHPSAPSPAQQARPGRPPDSPRPSVTCPPSSRPATRRRSSRPPPPSP